MPIRLNLLAEQQAAEEARRRDPVKRAVLIGGLLVGLVLLWSGKLQLQISTVRWDLAAQEASWKQLESQFLQVSNQNRESGLIRDKLESLQRYTTNRFLWAPALNALQQIADDQVRVISVSGQMTFKEEKAAVMSTNVSVLLPAKPWWKVWASPPVTNIDSNLRAALQVLTNKPDLQRFQSELILATNVSQTPIQMVGKLDVTKPETVSERTTLVVRARDYSHPPGSRVDRFNNAFTNHPFFAQHLGRTNSIVQPEITQQDDRSDLINPTDLFIPFTLEFRFPERIRSNE